MEFIFLLDFIRIIFVFSVSLISILILVYRFYYIRGDFQFYRFYVLVVLFIMSIIIIIIRPSLFRVLLGWDILGVVSFCLVVYYQNNKRFNSGIVTILRNRLGDSFIILTLC